MIIKIELGSVKQTRGKEEYHFKPAATALGITVTSYTSPIKTLLAKLLEQGAIEYGDHIDVFRGEKRVFTTATVDEWMDSRVVGKQPGSRPWLKRNTTVN